MFWIRLRPEGRRVRGLEAGRTYGRRNESQRTQRRSPVSLMLLPQRVAVPVAPASVTAPSESVPRQCQCGSQVSEQEEGARAVSTPAWGSHAPLQVERSGPGPARQAGLGPKRTPEGSPRGARVNGRTARHVTDERTERNVIDKWCMHLEADSERPPSALGRRPVRTSSTAWPSPPWTKPDPGPGPYLRHWWLQAPAHEKNRMGVTQSCGTDCPAAFMRLGSACAARARMLPRASEVLMVSGNRRSAARVFPNST